jgi:SAM-dependent methyltransferase
MVVRGLRFGQFADEYDSSRPFYPAEAIAWLTEDCKALVVDIGAGTGKLTRSLVDLGLAVVAVEPDPSMLRVLAERVPSARALRASAENLPLSAGSVDLVIAGQAWHWFDPELAWQSALRVLSPTGRIAVAWNAPARRQAWQREVALLQPSVSPVTEDWWPPGIPRDAMETKHIYWYDLLTPDQICAEHSTHLAVRKLDAAGRAAYLEAILRVTAQEGQRNPDQLLRYERLTWCARSRS